jgi:NTE family protein
MKIGIALGGGGAKGLAHIGVLQVLREHGIVPDLVAGTSIGALIGALYCLQGNIEAVEEFALRFEDADLSPYLAPRPSSSGLVSEKRIRRFLEETLGTARIEDLGKPFFCPATDIRNGREVMLDRGGLALAVRASISLPVIFKPVRLRDRYLVDGGLVNPVPVDILKKHGADFIIAVNVIAPLPPRPRLRKPPRTGKKLLIARIDDFFSHRMLSGGPDKEPNLVETILATIEIMQQKLIIARLLNDAPDIIIHIDTSEFKMFEFYRPAEIIRRGKKTAVREIEAVQDRLRKKRLARKREN